MNQRTCEISKNLPRDLPNHILSCHLYNPTISQQYYSCIEESNNRRKREKEHSHVEMSTETRFEIRQQLLPLLSCPAIRTCHITKIINITSQYKKMIERGESVPLGLTTKMKSPLRREAPSAVRPGERSRTADFSDLTNEGFGIAAAIP